MTDLELTKRCAEKMGHEFFAVTLDGVTIQTKKNGKFNPLRDDVQAFALVKKLELSIDAPQIDGLWYVTDYETGAMADNENLNRAIVECVAKLPEEK